MSELAVPSRRLRVALNLGNELRAAGDGSSLSGLTVSLGRELADHLGLSFSPVKYRTMGRLLRGAAGQEWDVGFLSIGPQPASLVEFTSPYVAVENTYLVPAAASIRSVADADEPGVRVGVARGSAPDFHLTRLLRSARLVRVSSDEAAAKLLRMGKVDAVASSRPNLLHVADEMQGYWVLMEPIFEDACGIAVPKSNEALLSSVGGFIERAKASGLIEREIDRRKLPGIRVASDN